MTHTEQDLPHLLRRAHFACRQAMDNKIAEYGLTFAQLDVLRRVAACECAEHRSLLQDMEIASPTLTKLVNGLVESGYLERTVSPQDARVKQMTLTESGQVILAQLIDERPKLMAQFVEGFTQDETHSFLEMLNRVINNAETAR
jgi:DNA-binding MarR family transcriptional regulator